MGLARRFLTYCWQGPASLPRDVRLEWRFVVIRWVGIVFVIPGIMLLDIPLKHRIYGYLVLVAAIVYNVGVQRFMRAHPEVIAKGYVTTTIDGLLNIAMIVLLGVSFDSPIAYFLFSVVVSAAMRFGYGPSLAMAGLYIGVNFLQDLAYGHPANGTFIIFAGFLFVIALMASYLREEAKRAEAALQERLRQASLLNTVTGPLAGSLDLPRVLEIVAAAASRLYGDAVVLLAPSSELGATEKRPGVTAYPASGHEDIMLQLADAGGGKAPARIRAARVADAVRTEVLPSGKPALFLHLVVPSRSVSLASLALAPARGGALPNLDPDILESFVERVTLTIENALLYDAVARGAADLQRAYGDLADAHQELLSMDEMKTTFLSNVSHELRTPLTSIRGFSELLLTYDDPDVRQEFLEIINRESERLTRLVNDVLDVTKIESGHMAWHKKTLDVAELLRETARTCLPELLKPEIVFTEEMSPDLPAVEGDRDRLQQLVANLLTNAVKFTPGGSITLRAVYTSADVHVSIADTGIGIAPEDHERIFEKFQQVGPIMTNKPRGTGLGLAICRDIVHHHGGRIWVESDLGRGSTFTFTLPHMGVPGAPSAHDAGATVAARPERHVEGA